MKGRGAVMPPLPGLGVCGGAFRWLTRTGYDMASFRDYLEKVFSPDRDGMFIAPDVNPGLMFFYF